MKTSTFFSLVSILIGLAAQLRAGPVGEIGERCLCLKTQPELGKYATVVKSDIFYPSPSCPKTEIVVILKKGRKVCLNPDGKEGKMVLSGQKLKAKIKRLIQNLKGKSKQRRCKKKQNKKQKKMD